MLNIFNSRRFAALGLILALAAVPALADIDQAMSHFKTGKFVEAAAEFQALVDSSPNYDFGYFMLGLSLLQMKKPKEAEESLLKAIELNGEKFEYHHGLAKAYVDQNQPAKAIATLKTAEPLATDNRSQYALYSLRGYAYSSLEKWSDAVNDLEKARSINPQASILMQLGKAYFALGHNDKAAPAFRQALKLSPGDEGAQQMLAQSLIDLGAEASSDSTKQQYYNEALQAADAFSKSKPNSFEAHNLVGRAALGAKKFDRAEQAFRKVLATKSDYCYAMVNLGKTYIATERWGDAESILKEAAACAPKLPVVHESLGFALQKQRRLDDAIQAYEKAYSIKPSESIRAAIETCKTNIEVAEHNAQAEAEAQAQAQAEAQAKADYEAALAKQKQWEEERKKDD